MSPAFPATSLSTGYHVPERYAIYGKVMVLNLGGRSHGLSIEVNVVERQFKKLGKIRSEIKMHTHGVCRIWSIIYGECGTAVCRKFVRQVDNSNFFHIIFDRLIRGKLGFSLKPSWRTRASFAYREVKGTESKLRGFLAECLSFFPSDAWFCREFIETQKSVGEICPT